MSEHKPQVPGQFTEGDEGLPGNWEQLFAENRKVGEALTWLKREHPEILMLIKGGWVITRVELAELLAAYRGEKHE